MRRVWFITRSYYPMKTGGAFVRKQQVEFLRRNGFDVKVISPKITNIRQKDHFQLNIFFPEKFYVAIERLLLVKDYLFLWTYFTYQFLKKNVQAYDIIFVSTGGEVGFLSKIKKIKKIFPENKIVLNYHDLIDCAYYEGTRTYNKPHRKIDDIEKEAIENSDFVITQSNQMTKMLMRKFSISNKKIDHMYFGYSKLEKEVKRSKVLGEKISLFYVGNMGKTQSPEFLIDVYNSCSDNVRSKIEIVFVGDFSRNKKVLESSDIRKIDFVARESLVKMLNEECDFAVISAINNVTLKPLMPTKFYEYLNAKIPILCIGPQECEVSKIIEENEFGFCFTHGDLERGVKTLNDLVNKKEKYPSMVKNIDNVYPLFDSEVTLKKMLEVFKKI